MNCPKCRAEISQSSRYCATCGTALGPAIAPTAHPTGSSEPPASTPTQSGPPKRSLAGLLTVVAAVALLGTATAFAFVGCGQKSTPKETPAAAPKAPAAVAPAKGLSVFLNGLQAGSPPLPEMRQVADNNGILDFVRPNDRTEVLGVPVRDVRYGYVGGKLLFSVTYSVTAANAAQLLSNMKGEYGEAEWKDPDGFLHWYEPKGAKKGFTLSAAYFVETTGEAGIAVVSGPIAEKLAEQVATPAAPTPEPATPTSEAASAAIQTVQAKFEKIAEVTTNQWAQNHGLKEWSLGRDVEKGILGSKFTVLRASPHYQFRIKLYGKGDVALKEVVTGQIYEQPGAFSLSYRDEEGNSPYFRPGYGIECTFRNEVAPQVLRDVVRATVVMDLLPIGKKDPPPFVTAKDGKLSDLDSVAQRGELEATVYRERKEQWTPSPALPGDVEIGEVRAVGSNGIAGTDRIDHAVARWNQSGMLTIAFRTTGYAIGAVSHVHVRLLDRNGSLLKQLVTEELHKLPGAPGVSDKDGLGFSSYAHPLSFAVVYPIPVRDLRDAAITELSVVDLPLRQ